MPKPVERRGPHLSLSPGPRRTACARRRRRLPLPAAHRLAAGRLPRRRPLLRPQRLPDHVAAARGMGGAQPHRPATFWLRRARRLLPALVVVVLAGLVLAAIFARDDLAHTRGDAVSSLLYYTNWHEIIANNSYFDLMGRPSLLQHLWSLAVEEQFYVIWPLLLVPGLVLVGRKRLPVARRRRHRAARRRSCGSSTTRAPIRRASATAPTRAPSCC